MSNFNQSHFNQAQSSQNNSGQGSFGKNNNMANMAGSMDRQQMAAEMARVFVSKVYAWMFGALAITALVSYLFSTQASLLSMLFTEAGPTPLYWIAVFAPVGLVLLISFTIERMSMPVLASIYVVFSVMMGLSMAVLFALIDEKILIVKAFGLTSLSFGIMAVLGFTTKLDLSRFGMLMMIGFVCVLIASIINIFLGSDSLSFLIDIVCIIVFTSLAAYKMQQVRLAGENGGGQKEALFWGLSLYITFINLFLTILRLLRR